MPRIAALLALLIVASLVPTTGATAQSSGTGSDNLTHVDNMPYPDLFGVGGTYGENYGTDSDFIELEVIDPETGEASLRQVGVFGSINSGAYIMDVTDGVPQQLAWYPCSVGQGDVMIFQQTRSDADGDKVTRTYFTFADDAYTRYTGDAELEAEYGEDCVSWAMRNGRFGTDSAPLGNAGIFADDAAGSYIVEITDPRAPTTVQFVPFALGSHNMTVHPSGDFLYNSNSELYDNAAAAGIEIVDISDLDDPVRVDTLRLPPTPGLGTDSHDITFNADGSRAYSAALSKTVIINTEDPANPSIVSTIVDPQINVEHQADPITLTDPLSGLEREYLIVEDEFAGAAGAEPACPSGGVHVYDITGPLELVPVKVGYWNIDDVMPTELLGSCTAHVFELHDAGIMTMSFYNGGIRVVDIRSLIGLGQGSTAPVTGMREIGFHYFPDSDSWSVKTPEVEIGEDGELDFWLYSDDIARGLDTYHFVGNINDAGTGNDVWLSASEAAEQLPLASVPSDYQLRCVFARPTDQPSTGLVRGV